MQNGVYPGCLALLQRHHGVLDAVGVERRSAPYRSPEESRPTQNTCLERAVTFAIFTNACRSAVPMRVERRGSMRRFARARAR